VNILITGASGYIGKHLIANLLSSHNDIAIYVVYRKPPKDNNKAILSVITDLKNPDFTKALPEKIDVVLHLAQSNLYRNFPQDVEDIFAINVYATQLLLEWGRRSGTEKFIYASTGNVYQQQNKLLTEEDACNPKGYYGASKYAAEQLIKPYSVFFQTTILRFFGVYGPGQKLMTIPNIIDKVLTGKEITLAKGEGLKFTPLYIDDCTEMLKRTIFNGKTSGLYNIAGSEVVHLGALVELVSKLKKLTPVVKLTNNEPTYLMGDGSLFNADFEFKPQTDINVGLKKTLEFNSL
jgi:UDP-glucose 4-epimerase